MGVAKVVEQQSARITFAVDDVTPATLPLAEVRESEALERALGGRVEACSSYSRLVVPSAVGNPFLGVVHAAFSSHRPVVLTPDTIWLTIAQGIAQHVNADPERCRGRLVRHEGRESVVVVVAGHARGSPENLWPEIVESFALTVRPRVEARAYDLLVASFDTTGPAERVAYHVTLLDALRAYFDYEMRCICGIPTVTLEGTPAAWTDLRRRVEAIDGLGLGLAHWTRHLVPIARELERSAAGSPDVTFWQGIYKLRKAYGGETFSGWIGRLFPYVQDGVGRPSVPNPQLVDPEAQLFPRSLPSGLSSAPITVKYPDGREDFLEVAAGFVGAEQDHATLALKPRIGWAVHPGDPLSREVRRLGSRRGLTPPLALAEASRAINEACMLVPRELAELYAACNGGDLGDGLRLFPVGELDGGGERDADGFVSFHGIPTEVAFAALPTGERLALGLERREIVAVGPSGTRRNVAKSLAELLRALLDQAETRRS